MPLRIKFPIIAIVMIVLVIPAKAYSGNQVEYTLEISDSGSVTWTITQTLTVSDTYDTLGQLQDKIELLVDMARNVTAREMFAEAISISSVVSGSYISVEYVLRWDNFSRIGTENILVGDVFEVQDLFWHLYGDGTVRITYPFGYSISRIVPSPSQRDDSMQLLEWLGTAEFDDGNVDIMFSRVDSQGFLGVLGQNIALVGGVAIVLTGFGAGILLLRLRKKKEFNSGRALLPSISAGMESEEEKIAKMLKSAGGSAYQSAITEYFRFSRSKTSQLLLAMEKNGIIRRHKKGRDKIVTLVENVEERK